MAGTCEVLTLEDVVAINRRMLETFGGLPFSEADNNLVNRGALENALYRIEEIIFGVDRYPSVLQKAAAVGWCVMAGHVFHDGNKRTGMECCFSSSSSTAASSPFSRKMTSLTKMP
jgi:death on curing protein